jgi:hypothetical protein
MIFRIAGKATGNREQAQVVSGFKRLASNTDQKARIETLSVVSRYLT